jgi:uncharacterized linocin/CFP29 family protein
MAKRKTVRSASAGTPVKIESGLISDGKIFIDNGGQWAAQRLEQRLRECGTMGPDADGQVSALRTLDTLSKDDWITLDKAVIQEAQLRMRLVADINNAGLVYNVPNAMGKLILQHQTLTDMGAASISLDGKARGDDDDVEYDLDGIPLPIISKDFTLNLRQLEASRNSVTGGLPLDTTLAERAARKVGEACENMVVNGGPTFGGLHIYGLTNYPQRFVVNYTAGNWVSGATAQNMINDILLMINRAATRRMYGPFKLVIPPNYNEVLEADYNVAGASLMTIRERILKIEGIKSITLSDWVPNNNIFLVQMTQDVIRMVNGVPVQTIQWDDLGGFIKRFKVFTIMVPQFRADAQGRSGIVHMH